MLAAQSASAVGARSSFGSQARLSSARPVGVRRARACVSVSASATTTVSGVAAKGSDSSSQYDVVIVGGGLSGLCTAQALNTKHADLTKSILVTEARDRVGGNITTVSNDEGYLWEEGPNSFQVDCGLKDELVFGDPEAPRFVFWNGQLRPVPAGPLDLPIFDLMSIPGKIRAGLGALGIRPSAPSYEESVEQFVRRNLGAEVFERLIEPFCSGVYAGDPSKLSMKAAFGKVWRLEDIGGSIIGGVAKLIGDGRKNPSPPWDADLPKPKGQTVASFRKGLQTLPRAIEKILGPDRVKVSWELTDVKKESNGYALTYSTPQGPTTVRAKSVVFTIPSHKLKDVLKGPVPATSTKLQEFYYPPVGAVTVAYPLSAIKEERLALGGGKLKGFGQLHPRSQKITTLGTIYSSVLFPNRCPEGQVLLLNYIGGAQNTSIEKMTDDQLVEQVDRDLRKMLIKDFAPPARKVGVRVWRQAIPQFNVGHLDVLEGARKGLSQAKWDGVFIGGNYAAGVALGRCVEGAYESAAEVATFLEKAAAKQ